ncbi:hypothetical protein RSOLAG1IB_07573 [Rhizoctonia solani AG-1 IB]|uniref:Uncharacterized protein n=2 Tax=Thanatephorus cucumeris (strain AG1-IB / isolate 7/3/14) TaxID=1108050 RepID=A0A0B7FEV6_THACB|nr:hypothetical protein RSOLAG1IB_07573 [Rhizoctonia solani AG-1 IB]
MPSASKLIAPLKDALKRHKGGSDSDEPTGSLPPPGQEPYVARDYVTVPSPSQDDHSAVLHNQAPDLGGAAHPLDVQSDLASAHTIKYADKIEPESEDSDGEQELTDTQLRRLYDDEEIERFLAVFSKATPSVSSGNHGKTAVLRSNGQGRQGLEFDVYEVDDSDTETDVGEPWTYFNSSDGQSAINTPPTTPGPSTPVETRASSQQPPTPTYLSARIVAWIIPRLPPAPIAPPHRFRVSDFRLAGQRLYLGTYPFYASFFADLAKLATWSDWDRSARVCAVWWIFWYFNLLLPALFGKILVSLMRRRVVPYPSLKALRERRRLSRGAEDIGDTVEGYGAATSFFGTRGVPGIGQGGGDMGMRNLLKMTRTIIKGKSKKGKEKAKDAGNHAAAQMGLSSEEEEDELEHQIDEEDWRTSALKTMEDIADIHERVRNLWLWRREQSSRIYTLVLALILVFVTFTPAQILAKTTYAVIGVFYWFIIPILLAMPPDARKRLPPPLFDVPTDAEYAMSLMSIRVAKGESIVPASLRNGREHGRARRFIASINPDSTATPATPHKNIKDGDPNADQDVHSMRQEAEEKEAVVSHERAVARDVGTTEGEGVPFTAGPPAEVGTLDRLKSSIEASTADLLGKGDDDSTESLQGIGAPQSVPANHKATPGMLNLNSEGISFTPLLSNKPRMQVPLECVQGVKKTNRTSGLRVRYLSEGIEHEDVFRFVPNRDEIFGKLVGWGGKRWKKVP